jgi:hypothetical protein
VGEKMMKILFGLLLGIFACWLYPSLPDTAFSGIKQVVVESGVRDQAVDRLRELK